MGIAGGSIRGPRLQKISRALHQIHSLWSGLKDLIDAISNVTDTIYARVVMESAQ